MDRFVVHGGTGTPAPPQHDLHQQNAPQPPGNMTATNPDDGAALLPTATLPASAMDPQYQLMAQAVAAIISPTITEAVERAVAAGISQLRKELGDQARRILEVKHGVSDLKDELQSSFTK